jgi:putative membrane protein
MALHPIDATLPPGASLSSPLELGVPPEVIAGVVAIGLLYAAAALWMRRRVSAREAVSLAAALATILFALGPVDAIAEQRLFTAHMFQHVLLTLVMPPLLLLGLPPWMLRPALRWPAVRGAARFLTHPVVAFVLYNGVLAAVHTPPVFERMVSDESVHHAIHFAMMATGVLMWWPLLSPLPELPRLSYPAQTLYLFLLLIPMAAISAPITLASEVIYPWYRGGPHPWGLTPLADQVLGGLLMWIGTGLYFMAVFTAMFFRWAQRDDRDEPAPTTRLRLHVVP